MHRLPAYLSFLLISSAVFTQRPAANSAIQNEVVPLSSTSSDTTSAPAPFGKYTETVNGVAFELVRMPQGSFIMGNDRSPNPEEKPAHQVNLRSFYIGQYEITRKQWNIVAETLPRVNRNLHSQWIDPALSVNFKETTPADVVFWDEAMEFCRRLSNFTGKKYRLPSEAEWEYACRAGTQTEYSFGNEMNYKLAHFRDITAAYSPSYWILSVGEKGYANAWGLYDMHGNVGEWCLDAEHRNYWGAPTDGSAWGEGDGCQRGGYYGVKDEFGRSSSRLFWGRNVTVSTFGFRIAADILTTTSTSPATAISAASYLGPKMAPESIAAIFGSDLSRVTQAASSNPLPTTLAGTSAYVKDIIGNEFLAPIFFTSSGQINLQIPLGPRTGPANLHVLNSGTPIASAPLEIAEVSPGLFTADASGKGPPAAVVLRIKFSGERSYEPVSKLDATTGRFVPIPIDLGELRDQVYLICFGTGFRFHSSLRGWRASIGNTSVIPIFVGAQGELAGLDQCNFLLPKSLAGQGETDLAIEVDGVSANRVMIMIK